MQYFLHKEDGHVASLDDDEAPSKYLLDPESYVPVHLHEGGRSGSQPPQWFKVVFSALVSLVMLSIVACAVGGAVAIWNAVL